MTTRRAGTGGWLDFAIRRAALPHGRRDDADFAQRMTRDLLGAR